MINRREFLLNSALLASAAMFLPGCGKPKPRKIGPNDKLNVAVVGCGNRGFDNLNHVHGKAKNAQVVALCDVDDVTGAKGFNLVPSAKRFRDYRVMLDKMDKDIDAVLIATPDHMHYPISAWAIAKGKHVYCEKPLTRTIWEARDICKRAKEAGVVTQMGNQGHTFPGWRILREWAESGLLGEIEDIWMWTDRPCWPQGADLKIAEGEKVPSTLDYKLWLGVAPYLPYSKNVVPFRWRGLRNFGTGSAGDMACHFFDTPYSGLQLGMPESFSVDATPHSDLSWPAATTMVMNFNSKFGKNGKIKLHWSDGRRRPKHGEIKRVDDAFIDDPRNLNCLFVVGSKGTYSGSHYGTDSKLYPRNDFVNAKKNNLIPAEKYARSKYQGLPQIDWMNACIEGRPAESNFDYACPFTELVLLSMVGALVPNRELTYNSENMTFPNCPEANAFTKSLYAYNKEFLP